MSISRIFAAVAIAVTVLTACGGGDPGPLKGSWRVRGVIPMTVHFRDGESEAMGIIDKVSYKTQGRDVIVTYESGMAKGSAMRFIMTGPNTAQSEIGSLTRIK